MSGQHSGPGESRSALSYGLGKLRTEIVRRLTWLPVIAFILGIALAFAFAPAVDSEHSPDRLNPWFILVLTVLVTFGVGLLFFQRGRRGSGALRFLGAPTAAYVLLGICAAILGVLPLQDGVYRCLFAATVGTLAAVLTTVALVGIANLNEQRQGASDDARDEITGMQRQAREKPERDTP